MSIKIYRTQLTPAKNALLDNIEDYLNQIEQPIYNYTGNDEMTYSSSDFQYIKPDLDISIKINLPITNNNLFDSIGNYIRIEQKQGESGDISIWYYFIIASKWIAQGTLELVCSMDTVNTFHSYINNINNWSNKTTIFREHQVPIKRQGSKLIEVVDRYDEGIDPGVLYKVEDTKIEEPNSLGIKEWYLVYQTTTAATESGASENKMRCYLYPSENVVYSKTAGQPASSFVKNDFGYTNTYGIVNGGVNFSVSNLVWQTNQQSTAYNQVVKYVQVYNSGQAIYNQSNSDTFPSLSGHVYINDSFTYNDSTYICDRILWNSDTNIGLPVGIFKNGSNAIQAFYLTSFNGNTINKWVLPYVYTNVEYISARMVRSHIYRRLYTLDSINSGGSIYTKLYTNGEGMYTNGRTYTFSASTQFINRVSLTQSYPDALTISNGTLFYSNGGSGASNQIIQSIKEIDRQDPKIVKILAIPYCPTPITIGSGSIESGTYTLNFDDSIIDIEGTPITADPERWRLYYKNIYNTFGKDLDNISLDTSYTRDIMTFWSNYILTTKSINNEPKLRNSKFYRDLFVYDNVSKLIRREDLDPTDTSINITPYYMPTNTIDSKMMFKFNIDKADYKEIYEWDRVLVSTRDNELPIYNNDYINYLRYSYKAERENLQASAQAQRQAAYTSSAITTGGGLLSGALLGAKIGSAVPGWGTAAGAIIGGVIGLAAGMAQSASTINSTNTTIQNAERSMSQKLLELNNTSSSVINGSAAVDLMTEYSGNRLHHMVYDLPDLLKDAIYDRLFYCGYSHPVQEIPVMNNRYIFNFIQCNPVFIDESTNRYNYYMADIKDRFNTGITRYHNISTLLSTQDQSQLYTDWKQEYENWPSISYVN